MLLEYYRAYIMAKIFAFSPESMQVDKDEVQVLFIQHMSNCMNMLFGPEFEVAEATFNSCSFSLSIDKRRDQPENKVLACILQMIPLFSQNSSQEMRQFSLFILQRATEHFSQVTYLDAKTLSQILDVLYV